MTFEDLLSTWMEFGYSPKLGLSKDTNHARIYFARVLWSLRARDQLLREWLRAICEALDLDTLFAQYRDIYPDEVEEFYHLCDLTSPGRELSNLQISKFSNLLPSVQLTTIHSSKGTEFEVVIVTGVEQIETSANGRRLLYVGCTRAKRELCLLYTKVHPPWSRSVYPSLPQYIKELKAEHKRKHWTYFTHETCK
jgi:superfamily I DNA/RNA helicase